MGSLLLVVTMFSGAPGIGWGRPVPIDGASLRYGRMGMAIVSAAGPVSNLLLALVAALALRPLGIEGNNDSRWWADLIVTLLFLNVGLAAFNLLPIAPLDGFGVLMGVLPWSIASRLSWLGQYGPGILLILVFSGSIIRINLLSMILDPVRNVVLRGLLGIAAAF
jgi:Zn-dependent protease